MAETWKPIPGYEGLYEVSDRGRVKRLPHVTKSGRTLPKMYITKCYSKPGRRGYRKVSLRDKDGKHRLWFVHRLVLLAFVGPIPEGTEVCHGDGNGRNNKLENLRYDTRSENQIDVSRVGHRNNGIEDVETVKEMRQEYNEGMSIPRIAEKHGLKYHTVYDILKGRTYTWV